MSSVTSGDKHPFPAYNKIAMAKTLGQLIRSAREKKGLSQDALGKSVGKISREAVAQWESDETVPSPKRWGSITTALEIPMGDFQAMATGQQPTEEKSRASQPASQSESDINRHILRLVGENILASIEDGKIDMTPAQFGKLLDHLYSRLQKIPVEARIEHAETLLQDMLAITLRD